MATIVVEARVFGRRRHAPPPFSFTMEPTEGLGLPALSLRDLIARIVEEEIAAFQQRQRENRMVHILTAREMAEAAEGGRIAMGGRDLVQDIDAPTAVATALQAFEDGLYLTFVDGIQVTSLDAPAELTQESKVTFVRLTPLAGG